MEDHTAIESREQKARRGNRCEEAFLDLIAVVSRNSGVD